MAAMTFVILQSPPGGSVALLDNTKTFNTTLTATPYLFTTEADAKAFADGYRTNAIPTFAISKAALDAYVTAKGGVP